MRILALCDSPVLQTGFGRISSNLLRRWSSAGHKIDVWALGIKGRTEDFEGMRIIPAETDNARLHWYHPECLRTRFSPAPRRRKLEA